MMRKRPFAIPERQAIPRRVKAELVNRQQGRCADCGTRLALGSIVFDHRPPIALREVGDDLNDPDRLAAICKRCDIAKTPADLKAIAKAKRLANKHQDHLSARDEKVPGRRAPVPRKVQELRDWAERCVDPSMSSRQRND